jgi:hypothetical protein
MFLNLLMHQQALTAFYQFLFYLLFFEITTRKGRREKRFKLNFCFMRRGLQSIELSLKIVFYD